MASRDRLPFDDEGGDPGRNEHHSLVIGRRDVLRYAGLALTAIVLPSPPFVDDSFAQAGKKKRAPKPATPRQFSIVAYRKEDFVALQFQFVNLGPDTARKNLVVTASPSYIVVTHQPQHILEQAYVEPPPDVPDNGQQWETLAPIPARLSGPSRVAFVVPSGITQIPFDLEGLLQACREYEMKLALNALPPIEVTKFPLIFFEVVAPSGAQFELANTHRFINGIRRKRAIRKGAHYLGWGKLVTGATTVAAAPAPHAPKKPDPAKHETAIELPFRLLISPDRNGQ